MKGLIPYASTDLQVKVIEMRAEGKTWEAITELTGMDPSNGRKIIAKVKRRAANAGYSPQHDMTHTVPDGFGVKGVSTMYDREGNVAAQWVKSQSSREEESEEYLDAIKEACGRIKPIKPIARPKKSLAELCTMYHFTDFHLAAYSYGAETGANWDTDIAKRVFGAALAEMMAGSPDSEVGIFSQGGDFCHWDGWQAVTPTNKFILDADTRFPVLVEIALECHIHAIEELLKKHKKVIAIIQEGNHDLASSVWLRKAMIRYFEKNKRVEVIDTEFPFYAVLHGKIMLAFHHGHKVKNKSLPALFASEPRYREMWGEALYCYIHTGHYHQREQDMGEFGGAIVERHPTLAARDAHATRGGYVSWRSAHAITYHKTKGEVSRKSVAPDE